MYHVDLSTRFVLETPVGFLRFFFIFSSTHAGLESLGLYDLCGPKSVRTSGKSFAWARAG